MGLVRTQVQLGEDQYRNLKQEAFRRGVSMSALLREILVERYTKPRRSQADIEVGLRMVGLASDSVDDVSERHDDYLYGEPG